MTAPDAPRGGHSVGASPADEVAAQPLLAVHNCTRLGRTANPPRLTLTDWLLAGRRRG